MITDEGGHDFTFSNLGRLNIPANYRFFKLETIYSLTVKVKTSYSPVFITSSL